MNNNYFYLSVLLGFIGSLLITFPILVCPYNDALSEIEWKKRQQAVVLDQLQGIGNLLREYKEKHDQYPTNEQGLDGLDTYASQFKSDLYVDHSTPDCGGVNLYLYFLIHGGWDAIKLASKEFRDSNGRYITNQIELIEAFEMAPVNMDKLSTNESYQMELAIDKFDNMYLLGNNTITDPWLIPYFYENRKGYDESCFIDSPISRMQPCYYLSIDNQIYVYSLLSEEITHVSNLLIIKAFWKSGAGLLFMAISIWIMIKKIKKRHIAILLPIFIMAIFFCFGYIEMFGTYNEKWCWLFSDRHEDKIQQQTIVLNDYAQNGVIPENALNKIKQDIKFLNTLHQLHLYN